LLLLFVFSDGIILRIHFDLFIFFQEHGDQPIHAQKESNHKLICNGRVEVLRGHLLLAPELVHEGNCRADQPCKRNLDIEVDEWFYALCLLHSKHGGQLRFEIHYLFCLSSFDFILYLFPRLRLFGSIDMIALSREFTNFWIDVVALNFWLIGNGFRQASLSRYFSWKFVLLKVNFGF
jgi:hypothetical protein